MTPHSYNWFLWKIILFLSDAIHFEGENIFIYRISAESHFRHYKEAKYNQRPNYIELWCLQLMTSSIAKHRFIEYASFILRLLVVSIRVCTNIMLPIPFNYIPNYNTIAWLNVNTKTKKPREKYRIVETTSRKKNKTNFDANRIFVSKRNETKCVEAIVAICNYPFFI